MASSVAITGISMVTSLGAGLNENWSALLQGSSKFTQVCYATDAYPGISTGYGASLAGDLAEIPAFTRRLLPTMSRESTLVSKLGYLAWQDARLAKDAMPPQNVGVIVGTTSAGLDMYAGGLRDSLTLGPRKVRPAHTAQGSINAVASELSISARAEGHIATVTSERCSGTDALIVAADQILTGRLTIALVAAVDLLTPLSAESSATTPKLFAEKPEEAPQGEAAIVLVVEDAEHARARGARIHIAISSWSTAHGGKDPSPTIRVMRSALQSAGLKPDEIGLVSSSAAGLRGVDDVEERAIHALIGMNTPAFSPFGALGNCNATTGLLQLAFTAQALRLSCVPPTSGLAHRPVSLLPVSPQSQPFEGSTSLVVTSDSLGHATAIVARTP
ncbi:beta-ketoacyl synthase N-terminal-like domain-containing protein [Streptomyces virginiae]|uniref:beta-ketoacyl synthase N-terminal-like domain-containing protein n=1 Tax=Streptomyces virginiae TaxID=1961 RepID=UPI00369ACD0D